MQYFVICRSRDSSRQSTYYACYSGVSKVDAISAFTARMNGSFSITAAPETLCFVGFDSDLAFLKEIKNLTAGALTVPQLAKIMSNLNLAICTNTLIVSGYKHKINIEHDCEECDSTNTNVRKNAYGNYLCADCWATYLTSESGLVEYYIEIANGTYNKSSFSEADLESITDSWAANKDKLAKTETEITVIETNYANAIG